MGKRRQRASVAEESGGELFDGEQAEEGPGKENVREEVREEDKENVRKEAEAGEEDRFTQARTQLEEEVKRRATATSRYQPRPDEAQVKQVRSAYNRLMADIRRNKGELTQLDCGRFNDIIQEANELQTHLHTTQDATLDSRFVAEASEIGKGRVEKLAKGSLDFTADHLCALVKDVMAKAVNEMADERPSEVAQFNAKWGRVGMIAMRQWLGVSTPDFFLGPIAVVPGEKRVRAARPRRERDEAPLVSPMVLDGKNGPADAAPDTTSIVVDVFERLTDVAPAPLYKLISHPEDYARSVENLFYLSFLVREGRVRLAREDGDLMVHVVEEEEQQQRQQNGEAHEHQAIYSMTMALWRSSISKYGITRPLLG